MKEKKQSVQDILEAAGDYSCLGLVYSFFAEKAKTPDFNPTVFAAQVQLILDILDGYNSGILDEEFFVTDAQKYLQYICPDVQWTVTKKDIKSMTELKGQIAAVRFDYNGHSHWVATADGLVIFDSLTNSQCRLKGKPTTARVIDMKELR